MKPLARLGYTLAAALGVAFFATLGGWQHSRGVEKELLIRQQTEAMQGGKLGALDAVLRSDDTTMQRAGAGGQFVPPLILLDGQLKDGRIGLRAYAVGRVEQAPERGVLVDLGWLPMAADRSLPVIDLPDASQWGLLGLMAPWPGQGLRAAENPWPEGADTVLVTYLDRDEISRHVGLPLATNVLRLDATAPYGFDRDQQLLPNTLPPERHFGYALQWYALAAAVAIVWLVLTLRSLDWKKKR